MRRDVLVGMIRAANSLANAPLIDISKNNYAKCMVEESPLKNECDYFQDISLDMKELKAIAKQYRNKK